MLTSTEVRLHVLSQVLSCTHLGRWIAQREWKCLVERIRGQQERHSPYTVLHRRAERRIGFGRVNEQQSAVGQSHNEQQKRRILQHQDRLEAQKRRRMGYGSHLHVIQNPLMVDSIGATTL
jgi:hypothetical protein